MPGAPFRWSVNYLAATRNWLFGIKSTDPASGQQLIDSFSIAANGVLAKKNEVDASTSGGALVSLFLDHTGSTLYADSYDANNSYLGYKVNHSTGSLSFVDVLQGGPANNPRVSFIGNNIYAYGSSCYHFDPAIIGVQRASDGTLSYVNGNQTLPVEKSGGFYCPWLAAADPTNHLAIALQPFNSDWSNDGPWQLASYTVDASGNVTTESTVENMPSIGVGSVTDYRMSPSGKYLAVGGVSGLQIFRFHGANPITKFTGLLTASPITQLYWDNANHLYAISQTAGKLYVYSVSSTQVTRAPGSPHIITVPQNMIVIPR